MFGGWKAQHAKLHRLYGAVFAMLAVIVLTVSYGGEAQACPPGAKLSGTVSIAHKVKRASHFADVKGVTVSSHGTLNTHAVLGSSCCGSHGSVGCQGACCGGCGAAALAPPESNLLPPDISADFIFKVADQHPPAQAWPQFRPPRRAV